jgi:hypothetical protein
VGEERGDLTERRRAGGDPLARGFGVVGDLGDGRSDDGSDQVVLGRKVPVERAHGHCGQAVANGKAYETKTAAKKGCESV